MHCHTSHGFFVASNVHTFNVLALGCRFVLLVWYNTSFDVTYSFKWISISNLIWTGFYPIAMLQETADRLIYAGTFHMVSGHTLKHLTAAMVPVILTVMLAKRGVYLGRLLHVSNTHYDLKFQWEECGYGHWPTHNELALALRLWICYEWFLIKTPFMSIRLYGYGGSSNINKTDMREGIWEYFFEFNNSALVV